MASKKSPDVVFNQALKLKDSEERATYRNEACAGDAMLRAAVAEQAQSKVYTSILGRTYPK